MALLAELEEVLHRGDPTVRSWFLLNKYYPPFVLTALYVLYVKVIGPALMKNRKPFGLRRTMIVYNFGVVAVYGYCLYHLLYHMFTTDIVFRVCKTSVVTKEDYTYFIASLGWLLYIIKYVEYADTVFFVLRKKDRLITTLHVSHHAILPLVFWIIMRSETNGVLYVPAGMNAAVHLIMYTYYGLAAMGPKYRKYLWWKEYLTRLQITSFVAMLIIILIIAPLLGCYPTPHSNVIVAINVAVFLCLFLNFYVKTYKEKSQPTDAQDNQLGSDHQGKDPVHKRIKNGMKQRYITSNDPSREGM